MYRDHRKARRANKRRNSTQLERAADIQKNVFVDNFGDYAQKIRKGGPKKKNN